MAENKKIYKIVINGLEESIQSTKSLIDYLSSLDKMIETLQNKTVKVKVDTSSSENKKVKVSGSDSASSSNKQLQVEKLITSEMQKQAQLEALQTAEGAKAYQETLKTNKALKERKKELESTLLTAEELPTVLGKTENELLSQIKLWNEYLKGLDRSQDGAEELYEKYTKLSTAARKMVEEMQLDRGIKLPGVFDSKVYDLLLSKLKEIPNTISGVNALMKEVSKLRDTADGTSEEFEVLSNALDELKQKQAELSGTPIQPMRAEDIINPKLLVTIGDMELQFDDVNQAVGVLEDKLYALTLAGDGNSDMAKELTDTIIKLRNVVIQTDASIDSLTGGSKGLKNVMSIVSGFTGIASIGTGLQQLFGGTNEELDKSLSKFAGLMLVLQGVENIQKEMNTNTTVFGKTMNGVWTVVDKIISAFPILGKGLDSLSKLELPNFEDISDKIINIENLKEKEKELLKRFDHLFENVRGKALPLRGLWEQLLPDERMDAVSTYIRHLKGIEDVDTLKTTEGVKDFIKEIKNLNSQDIITDKQLESFVGLTDDIIENRIALNTYNNSLKGTTSWLTRAASGTGFWSTALKGLTLTLGGVAKAIKALLASTIILLAVQVAIEGIIWVFEKLGKIMGIGVNTNIDNMKTLENSIAQVNKELERSLKLNEQLTKIGKQSVWQQQRNELKIYEQQLRKTGTALEEFLNSLNGNKFKTIEKNLQSVTSWGVFSFDRIKDLDEFRKKYNILVDAVTAGTDKVKQGGTGWEWWQTANDALNDLSKAQKAVIRDLNYQLKQIDFSNTEEAVKKIKSLLEDDLYASALANIEDLFPDEQWAKKLKKLLEEYIKFADGLKDVNNDIEADLYNVQKTIESNNIAAIRNRHRREKEEIENQYKWEVKEAAGNAELIQSIENKYALLRLNLSKQQGREIRDIQAAIDANYTASLKDGLDKRLKELEQSRQQEINAAKDSEILVGEQIKSINAKYDKLVSDEKLKHYLEMEDFARTHRQTLLEIELEYAQNYEDLQRRISEMDLDTRQKNVEIQFVSDTEYLSYDDSKGVEAAKDYYNQLLAIQKAYNEKKTDLEIEAVNMQNQNAVKDESIRYENALREIKNSLADRVKEYDAYYREGKISEQEYNETIAELNRNYNNRVVQEEKQHNELLKAIAKQGEADIEKIIQDSNATQQNYTITAHNAIINEYQKFYDEINRISSAKSGETTIFGTISLKKEKSRLNEALNGYKQVFTQINSAYANLQSDFEEGKISFGDFQNAKNELKSFEDSVGESAKDTQEELKTLGQRVAQSWQGWAQQVTSSLMQSWGVFNEIMQLQLDAEQAELDHKKEILDEETQAVEDAYQKQQEIIEKYTDKINSIEDELTTARGDRRQHLIDQLAKQREALIAEMNTESQLAQQKDDLAKREEALKTEQDALDKKRKEQEKRNSIVQATINTATAITNALAVQPWFVGVALSAVAAAMGAVQIAKIKSQKYADGGLLDGKSHSQGGMKIAGSNIEVEGGEYVINKYTTSKNLPLISFINAKRKEITAADLAEFFKIKTTTIPSPKRIYADGGQLPQMKDFNVKAIMKDTAIVDNRPIVVSVVDINRTQDNVRRVKTLAGLE